MAAAEAASTGCATPRSVTSAQTSAAGVTSNAGLRTGVPGTVSSEPAAADLVGAALLDLDLVARRPSRRRPTTTARPRRTGSPAACAASASAVGADLVGDVAVGRHTVEPRHDRVDLPACGSGRRPRRRRTSACSSPSRPSSHTVSRAPWSSGRASHASTRSGRRSASAAITPRPVPRPDAARQPELQCVRIVSGPAGRRREHGVERAAPCSASAALAASSSRCDRLGLRARGARQADRACGQRGGADAFDRPGQVAGGRAAAGEPLGAALQRAERRLARDLHRQPVSRRRRRSAARPGPPAARSPARCPRRPRARAPPRAPAAASGRARAGARRPSARAAGRGSMPCLRSYARMTPALSVTGLRKAYGSVAGAARRRPRARDRRAVRPARPQRRRQVDARQDRVRPRPAHLGSASRSAAARPARPARRRRSATSPSCSASPTGAPRTSCSGCTRS